MYISTSKDSALIPLRRSTRVAMSRGVLMVSRLLLMLLLQTTQSTANGE